MVPLTIALNLFISDDSDGETDTDGFFNGLIGPVISGGNLIAANNANQNFKKRTYRIIKYIDRL